MRGPRADAALSFLRDRGFEIALKEDENGAVIRRDYGIETAAFVRLDRHTRDPDGRAHSHRIGLESDDANGDARLSTCNHDPFRIYWESLTNANDVPPCPRNDVPPCPQHVPSPEQDYFTVTLQKGNTKNVYYQWIDDLSIVGLAFRQPFVVFAAGRWIRTRPIAYDHFEDELWTTSTQRCNAVGVIPNFSKLDPNHLRKDL